MKSFPCFLLVLLFAASAAPAQGVPFTGIQTHFGQFYRADMDSVSMEAQLDLVQQAGIGAVRDECYWADVEKERGVYVFPKAVDDFVDAAARRGIAVLLILDYNNPLYAPHAGSQVTTDSNRAAYAKYCVETVKRYSPKGVKQYELWNEPNLPMFWDPTPNAANYAALIKAAYPEIKKADSSVTVIAGATSPLEGQAAPNIPWTTFIAGIVSNGGLTAMDALSFHQYRVDKAPETWLGTDVQMALSLTAGAKPLWITEVGYHTSSLWPYTTTETQADYVTRMYLLGRSYPALKRISYYDLKNDGNEANNAEHNFGVLLFDRTPKPAYTALKTMNAALGSKPFVSLTSSSDNYTAVFGPPGDRTLALWNPLSSVQRTVKMAARSAYVSDRNGVRKLYVTADSTLTVTSSPSPRYVMERAVTPGLKSLTVEPKTLLLGTGQSFAFRLSGNDSSGVPAEISSAAASWSVIGGGSIGGDGKYTAAGAGTVRIAASFGGLTDTAAVTVFVQSGSLVMTSFDDAAPWTLSVLNLDSAASAFTISAEQSVSGGTSGKLSYRFKHRTGLGVSSYRAYLGTEMPVPGIPESLSVNVYGNGQPHRIEFRFRDLFGDYFSRTAADQPVSWNGEWRPVRIWMKGFGSGVDYPLTLDRLTVYTVSSVLAVDSVYSGTIYLDDVRSIFGPVQDVRSPDGPPSRFRFLPAFPNPFNPETTLSFELPVASDVSVTMYDLLGREVSVPFREHRSAGTHSFRWSASGLPSGLYVCRISAGAHHAVQRLLLLR